MKETLNERVRKRAGERCEYCGVAQESEPFLRFHIEHIIPRQHGGLTSDDNLALSCPHCNYHKGTNLSGIDSETGAVVALFHPRKDAWNEHFQEEGPVIIGMTAVGRTTVNRQAAQDE